MSTISVQTHFAAGHRILGLTGPGAKCRNIHGHTFNVKWVFTQHEALEFGTLKEALRGLVRTHWDHGFFLDESDDFRHYLEVNQLRNCPLDGPPTTERIAAEIAKLSISRLTTPWESWSQYPIKNPKDSDKPLYSVQEADLVAVVLEEGPENTATWTKPPFASGGPIYGISGSAGVAAGTAFGGGLLGVMNNPGISATIGGAGGGGTAG